MRIGYFTDTFYPTMNGVTKSIESFGAELCGRGHEVFVFCPSSDRKTHRGMRIVSTPSVAFLPYPEYKVAIPMRNVPELDIVHTHGPFSAGLWGLWTARRQEIPAVSTYHTPIQFYVSYLSKSAKGILEKAALAYCRHHYNRYDRIVAPSLAIKKMVSGFGVPVDVIPTGVDTKYFIPKPMEKSRKRLGIDCERMFLCLGRLSPEKNIDLIIKAADSFLGKDDRLYIVGKGPDMQRLTMMTNDERIIFKGFVPDADVPKYYSAADAFITASTADTQGLVLFEAMACGCPAIAADALAMPEFIRQGKNGRLFRPGSAKALADAAKGFRPGKKMREAAIRTAREYSVKKCTDKLEKLYGHLTSS